MSLSCCALVLLRHCFLLLFFFNDTATPEIYTLSLHDALPISENAHARRSPAVHCQSPGAPIRRVKRAGDRKSTRLNSSHRTISYAVFCWKKKTHHVSEGPADVSPLG